jgi:hypothetical protein
MRCLYDTISVESLLCHKFHYSLLLLLNFRLVADHRAQVRIFWTLIRQVACLAATFTAKVFTGLSLDVDVIVIIIIS